MTPAQREALNAHLHWGLAVLALWLVATSPWVSMFRRFPAEAGFFDYAHVVLGWLALVVVVVYCVTVLQGGRWQWFFPWASGHLAAIGRDLVGIARGSVPAADGPGLYGAIKGLAAAGAACHRVDGRWLVTGTGLGFGPAPARPASGRRESTAGDRCGARARGGVAPARTAARLTQPRPAPTPRRPRPRPRPARGSGDRTR